MPREGSRIRLVAVLGPTATGKSALALAIAERFGGEIINCDSTAVYRGFDIGTDKVAAADRRGIPHHLIDIVEPSDEYTAAQFARDAAAIVRDIHARGAPAAGGSDCAPGGQPRRRTVRARAARRDPDARRPRRSRNGQAVWRPGLSPGARAPARRPQRAGDPRADRAGEPALCAPPVDLVPQRA